MNIGLLFLQVESQDFFQPNANKVTRWVKIEGSFSSCQGRLFIYNLPIQGAFRCTKLITRGDPQVADCH